jgi:hypothetical protein
MFSLTLTDPYVDRHVSRMTINTFLEAGAVPRTRGLMLDLGIKSGDFISNNMNTSNP